MEQDSQQPERILYQLLREWLSQQEGGLELLADFERAPEEAALRLGDFLKRGVTALPPTLATYVSGGRVEKLVNIARTESVHFHLAEAEPTLTPEERRERERHYLKRIAEECRYLETEGVDRVHAELTDVFVMLEALESPRREMPSDIAPVPERAEEMELEEQLATISGRRETEREERAPPRAPPPSVPLSKALGEHMHLVILGEPGTGKTTTLQFVALCFAKAKEGWAKERLDLDEARIPMRVELREYDGAERLDRFFIKWLDRAYVPEALAQDWLTGGRLAVLLDGLDEVPEARRAAVVEAIERFATTSEGQRCRIVVTSRIAGYREVRGLGAEFGHYTIRPFAGPEDAQPYADGWLRALKPEAAADEAEEFLEAMEQQGGLRRVMSNPLLLRLTVAVYVETGEMARSRAELYRRYVEEVTWKRAEAREQPRWSRRQIEAILEAVAWALQTRGEQTAATLAGVMEEAAGVADGRELLDDLRERLGLLAVYGYERGDLVAFRHLTFREYFVAQQLARAWLMDKERAWRFLRPRLHDPAWREPILLLAGKLDKIEATELVRRILKAHSPYERELHRDLLLAAAVLGDGIQVRAGLLDEIIDVLLHLFLDVDVRSPTAILASTVKPTLERTTGYVMESWRLEHIFQYALVRYVSQYALIGYVVAKTVLGRLIGSGPRGINALLRRLSGRGRYVLLQGRIDEALIAVGQCRPDRIVEKLGEVLIKEKIERKALRNSAEWPGFYAHFETTRSIHQRAADILGHLKAIDLLASALASPEGRVSAAQVLARIKEDNPKVIDLLAKAAQSPNKYVREAVAWILSVGDSPGAATTLIHLAEDADSDVREKAVTSLGGPWSYPWAQTALIALLGALVTKSEEDRKVRGAAIDALRKGVLQYKSKYGHLPMVHSDTIGIDLAQAVEERQEPLWEAIQALQREGPDSKKAIAILTSIAADRGSFLEPSGLQEAVIGLLGVLGASRSEMMEPLIELMLVLLEDWPYRPVAPANAIVKLAESRPDEVLSILLEKGVHHILGKLAEADIPEATAALINLLQSDDADTRWGAAEALGQVENDAPEVVMALTKTLKDQNGDVREAAIWALASLGVKSDEIISHLSQTLIKGSTFYQYRSQRGLAWLLWNLGVGTPEVVSVLIEWCVLYWDDSRAKVMEVLPKLQRAAPETVESVLVEVVQWTEDDSRDHLGSRAKERSKAAEIIGYLGLNTPQVEKALMKALQDVKGASKSAAWALGKIGREHSSPEVVKALLDMLEDRWLLTQRALASSSPMDRDMEEFYRDWDTKRTITVVLSLGHLGRDSPEAKSALLTALSDDESEGVGQAAAIALGHLGMYSPTIMSYLLSPWKTTIGVWLVDAEEKETAAICELARNHPHSVLASLLTAVKKGSIEVVDVLLECLAEEMDIPTFREIARALRRRLTGTEGVANIAYGALDQVVVKLTDLEVAALGAEPVLFAPIR